MFMETERSAEMRNNASRLKTLEREAMAEGGSSDKTIQEFIEDITAKS